MRHILAALVALSALAALTASPANAQVVPQLTPNVMLLVDTSGSMQRVGNCACTTDACTECLPSCDGTTPHAAPPNRWSTILTAMTGSYSTYTCQTQARPTSTTQPDVGYFLPHFALTSPTQTTDGILDTYANRVKFGLMTFDNIATLTTQASLVTSAGWTSVVGSSSITALGDFSYGPDATFDVPGCATPFTMNNGARNGSAQATGYGRLLSPGTDATDTISSANAIQSELLALRPFGATPTAGMLEDLQYFYDNDPSVNAAGDIYRSCRKQYVILITDGYPNGDMRGAPFYCENAGTNGSCPYDPPEVTAAELCQPINGICTGFVDGIFVIGFNVSGDADAVARLNAIAVAGGTDASTFTADASDTNQAFFADDLNALKAAIETALNQASPDAVSRAAPALSSTASTVDYDTSASTAALKAGAMQSQFNAGYVVPANGPWSGVLERHRTTCSAANVPQQQAVDDVDRFHELLDARSAAANQDIYDPSATSPRTLFTVVPANVANRTGHLTGNGVMTGTDYPSLGTAKTSSATGGARGPGGASCAGSTAPLPTVSPTDIVPAETGLALVPFTWNGVGQREALFGTGVSAADAENIIDYVRGNRGGRSKFGDVYHSTPVVVGRPAFNVSDESFNLYRREVTANRPTMLYVGTNDGVLHAFVAEDITVRVGTSTRTFTAGHELWGFVPPYVFPSLRSSTTSRVYTVDGTPYVREVFFRRAPGQAPNKDIYHTLLIVPMGLGGGAYVALDVTNPFEPKFMWQFAAGSELGTTLGAPAVGQVLVNTTAGLQERAIAMLPAGGSTALDATTCGPIAQGDAWSSAQRCSSTGRGAVPTLPLNQTSLVEAEHHRCWGTQGRHLYFLDAATGETITHLGSEVFDAPLNGGVGVYSGEVGMISTRAFVSDADSNLWRIDLTSTDPRDWDAIPFADMFAEGSPSLRSRVPVGGQPSYGPPVISTDNEGRLVVLQSTGNTEDFNSTAPNRIVSYTENITYDTSGKPIIGIITNWVQTLGNYQPSSTSGNYGEMVTGPVQLFNGVSYFASYRPLVGTNSACGVGSSYIWGLSYRDATGQVPTGRMPTGTTPITYAANIAASNQVVMGVSISQQLTCNGFGAIDSTIYDPFVGMRSSAPVTSSTGGTPQLLALTNGAGTAAGAQIGEITRDLPLPDSRTRVSAFAGRAE